VLTEAIKYGALAYTAQPSEPEGIDAYANSLEALAAFYDYAGQHSLLRETLEKSLAIRRKAALEAPNNITLQRLSDKAAGRWGIILAFADDSGDESASSNEKLSILRRLTAIDPNNVSLDKDLVRELYNSGCFFAGRREFPKAIKLEQEVVQGVEGLDQKGLANFELEDLEYDGAVNLVFFYTRIGDVESARAMSLRITPLARRLMAVDSDQPNNRDRECLLYVSQAEVAAVTKSWRDAEQLFSKAIALLRQNLEARDYPAEREFYASCLARYGRAVSETGDVKTGVKYIVEGLEIMKNLRDSDRVLERDDLLNDIAEAKESLQYYQQRSGTNPDLMLSATH
jgi:tetratricopeptide (TPR) repeat protein